MNREDRRIELLTQKRDITRRLNAIKAEQKQFLREWRKFNNQRAENPNVCSNPCCKNITSPRTGIGKYGTRYKTCDECREKSRLRYGKS